MQAGIVLFPAIAGVNDYIRLRARQLGEAGFAVEVVDYYDGSAPPDLSSPGKIQAAVAALSDPDVLATAHAACERLRTRADVNGPRTGTLGFCIGGTYAMLAGSSFDGVDAVANYYGTIRYEHRTQSKPVSPLDSIAALQAPMIAHYGTADRFVPASDLQTLEEALQTAGKPYELFRYGGAPHAFDEDFRPAYRPVAAREAWQRTLTFLDWYLRRNSK